MYRLNWLFLSMLTGCLDFGPLPPPLDSPDQAVDGTTVDMRVADGRVAQMPDQMMDMAVPDRVTPDMAPPDMTPPDMAPTDPVPEVPDFTGETPLADWTWLDPPGEQAFIEDGALILEPTVRGWHDDGRGLFLYTTITGDFVIETTVHAGGRDGMQAPSTSYNVAGLLMRSPSAGPENWTLEAVGFQADALGIEGKFTVNGDSQRREMESAVSGRLRICRMGDRYTLLHRLAGGERWQVLPMQDVTPRPDLTGEVQVGVFAGGWNAPTIRARFERIRLGRPATCDGVIP